MKIGIDKINFFVPPFFIDMTDLAHARNTDPGKYHYGLGQDQMAVCPANFDIVTLAAHAADPLLTEDIKARINMVIVGTESSVDESRASAVTLHTLLGIQPLCRTIEVKQACFGATAALNMAVDHISRFPEAVVLVIGTDIAKYGLRSGGEPTQGAGAVAMLITANPRILEIENTNVYLSEEIHDFWRPFGQPYPIVNGPLSNATYADFFARLWREHQKLFGSSFTDFAAVLLHLPYTKMGKKALIPQISSLPQDEQTRILARYDESAAYSRRVGNLYTGSLYLGLISLLENSKEITDGDRLALFSYGSGAQAEFFTARVVPDFTSHLRVQEHQQMLDRRTRLNVCEYESIFESTPQPGINMTFNDPTSFALSSINDGIRSYVPRSFL